VRFEFVTDDRNKAGLCDQCHAHANLGSSSNHAVGGHSIKPDRRQQQRQSTKQRRQPGNHSLFRKPVADLFIEHLKLYHRQIGIDPRQRPPCNCLHIAHRSRRLDHHRSCIERHILLDGIFVHVVALSE
jgi:hypothetical protein